MNEEALRIAIKTPEAWECLTAHQKDVMRRYIDRPNVSAIARDMGASRQSVQKALRLSRQKFVAFGRTIAYAA